MYGARRWGLRPNFNNTVGYERKFPFIHTLEGVGDFGITPAFGIVECVKGLTKAQGFEEFAKGSLSNLNNKHFWCQKIKEACDKSKQVCGLDDIFDKKFYGKKFKKAFCCNIDDKSLNKLACALSRHQCENISKAFQDRNPEYGGDLTQKKVDYLLANKIKQQTKDNFTLNNVEGFAPYKQLYGVGDFQTNVPSTQQYAMIDRQNMLQDQSLAGTIHDAQTRFLQSQQGQKYPANIQSGNQNPVIDNNPQSQQNIINQITPEAFLNLRSSNQGLLMEINDLKNTIGNYQNQVNTLNNQLQAASVQIGSQQKVVDDSNVMKQTINQLQNQIQQFQAQLNQKQSELDNANSFKTSNVELNNQLVSCKNSNIELNNQITSYINQIKDLKNQLASLATDNNQLGSLHGTIDQLQKTIGDLKNESANKDQIINQCKDAIQRLQNALQEAQRNQKSGGGGGIGDMIGGLVSTVAAPITGILGGIGKLFGVGNYPLPKAQDWEIFLHKIIIDGEPVDKEKFIKILDDKIKNIKKVEVKEKQRGQNFVTEDEKEIEDVLLNNKLPPEVENQLEQEILTEVLREQGGVVNQMIPEQNEETLLGKKREAPTEVVLTAEENNDYKEKIKISLKEIVNGMIEKLSVSPTDFKSQNEYLKEIVAFCSESFKWVKGVGEGTLPSLKSIYTPIQQQIELLMGEMIREYDTEMDKIVAAKGENNIDDKIVVSNSIVDRVRLVLLSYFNN
jgi:uncharacterized coiled-coil DUF342 family protein